jgi:hypothetical protein
MTKHFLDANAWQKISVFTIHSKAERVGAIYAVRSTIQRGEYTGYTRIKALVRIYDSCRMKDSIRVQGEAIGGGYDMLTSSVGSAMKKTVYSEHFEEEAIGGGDLATAFEKIGYKLDKII